MTTKKSSKQSPVEWMFDIRALRTLFPEKQPRTHKKSFTPMITQTTQKRLQGDFIPRLVGGAGGSSRWGAQTHLSELAFRLFMTVCDPNSTTKDLQLLATQISQVIPNVKHRKMISDNLHRLQALIWTGD